jgi:hypothetical protein
MPDDRATRGSGPAECRCSLASPNDLWCADLKGEFKLGNGHFQIPKDSEPIDRWVAGSADLQRFPPGNAGGVLQFDPVFLTVARATIAGLLGLRLLLAFKKKRPARTDVIPLKTGRCFIDHALLSPASRRAPCPTHALDSAYRLRSPQGEIFSGLDQRQSSRSVAPVRKV